MENTTQPRPKHLGRKIMQMRELLGVTQETVAEKIGLSQQSVSKIEQNENVDDDTLEKVAKALGVNAEAIKNLDEEATVYNIVTNHGSVSGLQNYKGTQTFPNCTFNPIDKWLEAMEENKRLYEELLKSEREKVAMLQKLLEGKK